MAERALRIAVMGSGVAGWLAAAMLARAVVPAGGRVTLVPTTGEDRSLGVAGAALTVLPAAMPVLAGLAEDDALMLGARGVPLLGTAMVGWGPHAWFLPHGSTGAPIGAVAFHQLLGRLRREGKPARLGDHSLAAVAAQLGRYAPPARDPRSPLSTLDNGLSLDAAGLRALLETVAQVAGTRVAAPFAGVERDESGRIAAVACEDGSRIIADLFVDASGTDASGTDACGGTRWSGWNDGVNLGRVKAVREADDAAPPPYDVAEAAAEGSRLILPLQGARIRIEARAEGDGEAFEPGVREEAWTGNRVAIGASAGRVDPVHASPLTLALLQVERLTGLLPVGDGAVERREYNRLTAPDWTDARDFALLCHRLTGRGADRPVTDTLAHRLALWQSRGTVPNTEGAVHERGRWIHLLDEAGPVPRRIDALAAGIPLGAIEHHVARLRARLIDGARAMPPLEDHLRMIGHAAPKTERA